VSKYFYKVNIETGLVTDNLINSAHLFFNEQVLIEA